MRSLPRPNVRPPTLALGKSGGDKAAQNLAAHTADATVVLSFPDHWNRADVRGALYAMHGRVCAYCQTALPRNDRGDVEHFRPKSIYWWLAYDFSNYVLSCGPCNSNRKGNRFPLRPGALALEYSTHGNLLQEERLLVDPATDVTDAWFRTDYADPLCPVVLAAGITGVAAERVTHTIGFFELNRDPGLVKERFQIANQVIEKVDTAGANPGAADELTRMASRFEPHAHTVREILRDRRPDLIPAPADELHWFVDELCDDLTLALALIQARGVVSFLATARDETIWALAVLWHDPPAASAAEIEGWIDGHGHKALVANVRTEL